MFPSPPPSLARPPLPRPRRPPLLPPLEAASRVGGVGAPPLRCKIAFLWKLRFMAMARERGRPIGQRRRCAGWSPASYTSAEAPLALELGNVCAKRSHHRPSCLAPLRQRISRTGRPQPASTSLPRELQDHHHGCRKAGVTRLSDTIYFLVSSPSNKLNLSSASISHSAPRRVACSRMRRLFTPPCRHSCQPRPAGTRLRSDDYFLCKCAGLPTMPSRRVPLVLGLLLIALVR